MPIPVGSESVSVYVSIGIVTSRGRDTAADELIRDADVAMYRAKTAGKGRYQVFDPSMGAAVLERHGLKEELRQAIEREELKIYFQPIVALDSGMSVAEEALVRWEHPRRGIVSPNEFLPLAEETGLILSLGQYVLEEACEQARVWQGERDGRIRDTAKLVVHVNLSAVELRDPHLVEFVQETLARTSMRRLDLSPLPAVGPSRSDSHSGSPSVMPSGSDICIASKSASFSSSRLRPDAKQP